MEKIHITKTFIQNESPSELDFDLQDKFGATGENFVEISQGSGYADATPIEIDVLIKILSDLKSNGSTHVQIEDHCDHYGYDISAYQIRKSTDEEITAYLEKTGTEKEKQERISKLYNEIQKLQSGL
jgi:hypothetical protein